VLNKMFLNIMILFLVIHICSGCNTNMDISQKTSLPANSYKNENSQTSINTSLPTSIIKNKEVNIPILYYHCISDDIFGLNELFVSPKEFDKQMNFLKNNNYNVITFEQLSSIDSISNPVIITFDDGYENNFKEAYPILKMYNFKATIFLCTSFVNKPNMLKDSQIQEMKDLVNFQSHTLTHPDLTKLNTQDVANEIVESKNIIERLTNQKVDVFSYPSGYFNSNVVKVVSEHYKYAVITINGLYSNTENNYEIKRIYIPRNLDIQSFIKTIKNSLPRE
jgi:peptidoglycan/xylan/chitin deacetylase (PgdA/CDA1 family)